MKRDNRKTGLGRGLSTLLAETSFENEVSTTKRPSSEIELTDLTVPIEMLSPSANQPRKVFNESKLVELADSIKQNGLIQPIIVRKVKSGYEIVAGERRWRASQLAQKHVVPIVVREISDRAAIEYGLVENIQREDLNAIEEAQSYKNLVEQYNYKQDQLASVLGKSRSYIANIMRLLTLPDKVIEMVYKGEISAGHAKAIVGSENPNKLALMVIKEGLSVRQLEKVVSQQRQKLNNPKLKASLRPPKDLDTINLEKSLKAQIKFTTKINHNHKAQGGFLSIYYNNLDEFDEICEILVGTKS